MSRYFSAPRRILAAAALLLALTACRPESSVKSNDGERRIFTVTGVVKGFPSDGHTILIQHEAVSNYMPAMTMPFAVKDAKELAGLQVGDAISFQMVVTPDDGWVQNLVKTKQPEPDPVSNPSAPPVMFSAAHALALLDVGDVLPDYQFTNELGQPVRLSDYRGQVIAFTFFFTRCPFPTACPRLSENFEEAARDLSQLSGPPRPWHLFSITFDPTNDTPAILKEYGARYQANPARWSLLTGSFDDISRLADQFDEEFAYQGGSISHSFRTVVVDARGRVRRIFRGNAWSSEDLVRAVLGSDGK